MSVLQQQASLSTFLASVYWEFQVIFEIQYQIIRHLSALRNIGLLLMPHYSILQDLCRRMVILSSPQSIWRMPNDKARSHYPLSRFRCLYCLENFTLRLTWNCWVAWSARYLKWVKYITKIAQFSGERLQRFYF